MNRIQPEPNVDVNFFFIQQVELLMRLRDGGKSLHQGAESTPDPLLEIPATSEIMTQLAYERAQLLLTQTLYLQFDLEATRRENEYLRQMLEEANKGKRGGKT